MLVLRRNRYERVVMENGVEVEVLEIRGNKVVLGFVAPQEVSILREELIPGREDGAVLRKAQYQKGDDGR